MTIKISCDECYRDAEDHQVCQDCYRELEDKLAKAESDKDDLAAEVKELKVRIAELEFEQDNHP